MTPRLVACHFGGTREIGRLAAVLTATAAAHCGGWDRRIEAIGPPRYTSAAGLRSHEANTAKLAWWRARVHEAPDGAEVLLIDADTAILHPLDAVWASSFDLAFATKTGGPFPRNLGVLFVRVSPRTRAFVDAWWDQNLRLLAVETGHQAWRKRWGGINQSAFGRLEEQGALAGLAIAELGCAEWNCEESAWAAFDPATTRILHVKGELRRALFVVGTRPTPVVAAPAAWWLETEARIQAAARRSA